MKNLSLIDGFAVLYRAYYAFPEMKNEQGQNLNAVYGFLRMVLKRLSHKPDYLGIAWDSKEKTFRHELQPTYKATRKKMEDDFISQIGIIRSIIDELWIFGIEYPGYEADDLLASFAKKFQKNSDLEIYVYSGDKDLKQILDERIAIVDLSKDVPYKTSDFLQEFWFEPKSIVDYLALLGDAADNVKWVDGIWTKTALWLIQKYKNLETLYESLDALSDRQQTLLREQKEDAFFAKKMIQLSVLELNEYQLSDFSFSFDYQKYSDILCKKYGLLSLDKVLLDLKKQYEQPVQLGLF